MSKIKILTAFLAILGTTTAQTPTTKKVETIAANAANPWVIPYTHYELANGLKVVIHEDHSDPIVHVNVTYHVGSAREELGRSGFAHFFEHMMFQGSEHVKDDEHFKIIESAGGDMNGTTNTDRTNYFETVPKNYLETALWLEADRMGWLLNAVTQKKFEIQRATVKNERAQRYENVPYGVVGEKTNQALYPYGHPYSWQTIGYIKDLDRVNVEDLKRFFLRWYGPNNATIVISGDVKPEEAIKLVEKYFNPIPKCPTVKNAAKQMVTLSKDRYVSYEDNVKMPLLQIAYPTVYRGHPDEAALDALSSILSNGVESILYKKMVTTQKALSVSCNHPTKELSGEFSIRIQGNADTYLKDIDKLLKESLAEFEKQSITKEDLAKIIAGTEANNIKALSTIAGKASILTDGNLYYTGFSSLSKEIEKYNKVTAEDIIRVYTKYIKNKPAVYVSVYPKNQSERIIKNDDFIPKIATTSQEGIEYKNVVSRAAKDNIDRTTHPAIGTAPIPRQPNYVKGTWENGITIISSENNEAPSISMNISVQAGQWREPLDKVGLSMLLVQMLNQSTEKYTSEEFSQKLASLGSTISIVPSNQGINISIYTLKKNLPKTIQLLEERMLHPAFLQSDFDRVKAQHLKGLDNALTQPRTVANDRMSELLYGKTHISGLPLRGTKTSIESITLQEVKAFYEKYFGPDFTTIAAVGDITTPELDMSFVELREWKAKNYTPIAVDSINSNLPMITKTKIYLIDKDNAAQSEIRLATRTKPVDIFGDYYLSEIVNYPLGASFNSRINMNLREDKGYTYGARSTFGGNKFLGVFVASSSVKREATDSAIVEIQKEMARYRAEGMREDELEQTKNSLTLGELLSYENNTNKVALLKQILDYGLKADFLEKKAAILNDLSLFDTFTIADKAIPNIDKMLIIIVGDKDYLEFPLMRLGYEIIVLDNQGNVLK